MAAILQQKSPIRSTVTLIDKWRGFFSAMWRGRGFGRRSAGRWRSLGEIADGIVSGGVHPAQLVLLLVRQLGLLAAQLSFGAGDGHALAGSSACLSVEQRACRQCTIKAPLLKESSYHLTETIIAAILKGTGRSARCPLVGPLTDTDARRRRATYRSKNRATYRSMSPFNGLGLLQIS